MAQRFFRKPAAARVRRRLLPAILVSLLAGCTNGAGGGSATAPRTDRLVIGQGREFNSLLPFMNNGFTSGELIGLSFSLLVSLGPGGYVPDAATAVPTPANGGISRDGLTVTYHLRHDIRWQDGQPLTARDVVFTQRLVMDPKTLMPYRDGFDRVASIAAPDPYTVVVRLKAPYRLFVVNFLGPDAATGILPEHLLAHVADVAHSAYAAQPVGSGPYRIGRWRRGESVAFDADPGWYGGRPSIARIELRFIPDPSTRLTQLRTHEIDAELNASAQTGDQARGIAGASVRAQRAPAFLQMTFNLHDPAVAALPLRQAVALAIDAPAIAAHVSHGFADGRDGARGLYLWAYDPRAGYPAHDPPAARRRLDAMGWRAGADGIRRTPDGRRLAFTISLRADRADDNAAAVQIQQQLRAIGVDVALKTYSAPQFTANDGIIRRGAFTAELGSYFAATEPDPTIFYACADRGMAGFNASGFCDPVADAAMGASLATSDPARVRTLLAGVQRRINAALPTIFLWQDADINIVPARLRNFSDLLGTPFLNCGHWTL